MTTRKRTRTREEVYKRRKEEETEEVEEEEEEEKGRTDVEEEAEAEMGREWKTRKTRVAPPPLQVRAWLQSIQIQLQHSMEGSWSGS